MVIEYSGRLPVKEDITKLYQIMRGYPSYIFDEDKFWDIRTTDSKLADLIYTKFNITMTPRKDKNVDTQAFGEQWEYIRTLFQDAFQLALSLYFDKERKGDYLSACKVVHCFLNILGYSRKDEVDNYTEWSDRHNKLLSGVRPINQIKLLGKFHF